MDLAEEEDGRVLLRHDALTHRTVEPTTTMNSYAEHVSDEATMAVDPGRSTEINDLSSNRRGRDLFLKLLGKIYVDMVGLASGVHSSI